MVKAGQKMLEQRVSRQNTAGLLVCTTNVSDMPCLEGTQGRRSDY